MANQLRPISRIGLSVSHPPQPRQFAHTKMIKKLSQTEKKRAALQTGVNHAALPAATFQLLPNSASGSMVPLPISHAEQQSTLLCPLGRKLHPIKQRNSGRFFCRSQSLISLRVLPWKDALQMPGAWEQTPHR